jgi:hypothetical protein
MTWRSSSCKPRSACSATAGTCIGTIHGRRRRRGGSWYRSRSLACPCGRYGRVVAVAVAVAEAHQMAQTHTHVPDRTRPAPTASTSSSSTVTINSNSSTSAGGSCIGSPTRRSTITVAVTVTVTTGRGVASVVHRGGVGVCLGHRKRLLRPCRLCRSLRSRQCWEGGVVTGIIWLVNICESIGWL